MIEVTLRFVRSMYFFENVIQKPKRQKADDKNTNKSPKKATK